MRLSQASSRNRITTAVLVLADGTVFEGQGVGAVGDAVAEVCFNTSITGYQEIMTDPSYAGQIVTFTFPHIGNVGANDEDIEYASPSGATAARGAIFRAEVTNSSNYRARQELGPWMKRRGIIGLSGIDTRALTNLIREEGMPHGVIAHNPAGGFDIPALVEKARGWNGLVGQDLAKNVTTLNPFKHEEGGWIWDEGFENKTPTGQDPHIVVMDFGVKANILRRLSTLGARVTVLPAQASFDEIMAEKPNGVVLSNGPGDPAATGEYAVPVIKQLIDTKVPLFGICLGHQMLALAAGAQTIKMTQGHHGANHPVKDHLTGKVEIVSMNHGFTVDEKTLPSTVEATHTSLFDGTNSGIRLKNAPAFSVQHHPEASPGPQDSFYIFERFMDMVKAA